MKYLQDKNLKKCNRCQKTKPKQRFDKDKDYCKDCRAIKMRKYYQENKEMYNAKRKIYYKKHKEKFAHKALKKYHSFEGYKRIMYYRMTQRVKHYKNYKGIKLLVSPKKFLTWINRTKKYLSMYKTWKKSNFDNKLTPCIDRVNNLGNYSLKNIQLLTKSENSSKRNSIDFPQKERLRKKEIKKLLRLIKNNINLGSVLNQVKELEKIIK